jgi:uracil permease
MLFVAFGALVLVPLLTGLDPNVALFTAGIGTLIFQWITRGKVPIFLASSFAFIAPIAFGVEKWGIPGTLAGLIAAGFVYILLSILIKMEGVKVIERFLPHVVTGPVIAVIGLILAPEAIKMATGQATGQDPNKSMAVAFIALLVTIGVSVYAKGLLKLLPIVSGIVVGYAVAIPLGLVDFKALVEAPWFGLPAFTFPEFNVEAIFYILPVAIAPAIEHVGDILAIGSITGKNYIEDPGLHRTMLGDGVATSVAGFFGGPPNTTYSEVSGAVALLRQFDPMLMRIAAVTAIVLAFVGKLGGLLRTIPAPVMGGIMVLLFGAIAAIGIGSMIRAGVDLTKPRNLVIVSVILVFGIGGMEIGGVYLGALLLLLTVYMFYSLVARKREGTYTTQFGISVAIAAIVLIGMSLYLVLPETEISIGGIGLAGIVGIALNLLLPKKLEE